MGIFSRNYSKPGPGVPKDTPRKKGAARFFELLTRDLGDLSKLNILFSICITPTVAMFIAGLFGYVHMGISFILSMILAFPVGGAMVAYVYYITKMMRDDPSYVWFEFKRKFIENYKQAAIPGILCTAFIQAQIRLWIGLLDQLISTGRWDILWILIALLSVIVFSMIAPYIFLHLAYVDLNTIKIIKNSVLMSFGYLPRSFMGVVLGGIIWVIFILYLPVSLFFLPFVALFFISLSLLLCLSWVWPPFDSYFKIEETLLGRMEEKEENDENEET